MKPPVKIVTRMLADELFESVNQNNNKVNIDMRPAAEKKSQSPTELLLSALAACGGVDVVSMLKKRKKSIQEFVIETDGIRQQVTPHYFTDIHCKYIITSADVTEEELQKVTALAIEKYCSVATSLKSNITFSVQVIRP